LDRGGKLFSCYVTFNKLHERLELPIHGLNADSLLRFKLTLATPIIPALGVGLLMSSTNISGLQSKKTLGLTAAAVAMVAVSIPLVLIIRDNFPVEFMTTLDQPDWVGTVMTGYTWLMVVLSPIIAFALASDSSIKSASTDRPAPPST
jgi:hypothetical protein